jgi:hypothetical protein
LDIDSLQHRFDTFRSLMNSRIREILLVSSVYDAYIVEEDGTLEERIWQQYADRGLSTVPRIRKVSSVERALEAIRAESIDLALAIVHEEAELAFGLARQVSIWGSGISSFGCATAASSSGRATHASCWTVCGRCRPNPSCTTPSSSTFRTG